MRLWVCGDHLPFHGVPEPLADLVQGLHDYGWGQAHAWLTALGARNAVELTDGDVRLAAQPWQAMLDAVGSGTKLTAADYLPLAMVEQIAEATAVTEWWIGKANREDLT